MLTVGHEALGKTQNRNTLMLLSLNKVDTGFPKGLCLHTSARWGWPHHPLVGWDCISACNVFLLQLWNHISVSFCLGDLFRWKVRSDVYLCKQCGRAPILKALQTSPAQRVSESEQWDLVSWYWKTELPLPCLWFWNIKINVSVSSCSFYHNIRSNWRMWNNSKELLDYGGKEWVPERKSVKG